MNYFYCSLKVFLFIIVKKEKSSEKNKEILSIQINYRIPLNASTANRIFEYASEAKAFFKSIEIDEKRTRKLPDGTTEVYYVRKLAMNSKKFTPFFGFVNNLTALEGLYTDYILNGPLDEFHTFMFSQDHLETWFSAVRSSLGIIIISNM